MAEQNYDSDALGEINKRIVAALSVFEGDCPEARQAVKDVLDGAFEDGLLVAKPVWDGLNVTAVVRPDIHQIDITCTLCYDGAEE